LGAAVDVARRWFKQPAGVAALWAGIFAGPLAWAVDLVLSYSLVQWVCGGGPPVVLHLITLFALALTAAGAFGSWRALQLVSDRVPSDGAEADQRGYFMALLGLAMSALFATIVVAGAVPRWVLDACHQ
jgi:hypothetical protein